MFKGRALQAIDGKARLAIPATLRATIERNTGDRTLLIDRHPTDPCLIGYDRNWSDKLHAQIERDHERALDQGRPIDRANDARRAFATVEELPFDASGRFILPAFHRAKAKLGDLAFFMGVGDTFEIWDPQTLMAAPGIDQDIKDMLAFDLAQRGAA